MKDNYDYREKEVFIRTNPRPEGPNLHFVKSDLKVVIHFKLKESD